MKIVAVKYNWVLYTNTAESKCSQARPKAVHLRCTLEGVHRFESYHLHNYDAIRNRKI